MYYFLCIWTNQTNKSTQTLIPNTYNSHQKKSCCLTTYLKFCHTLSLTTWLFDKFSSRLRTLKKKGKNDQMQNYKKPTLNQNSPNLLASSSLEHKSLVWCKEQGTVIQFNKKSTFQYSIATVYRIITHKLSGQHWKKSHFIANNIACLISIILCALHDSAFLAYNRSLFSTQTPRGNQLLLRLLLKHVNSTCPLTFQLP